VDRSSSINTILQRRISEDQRHCRVQTDGTPRTSLILCALARLRAPPLKSSDLGFLAKSSFEEKKAGPRVNINQNEDIHKIVTDIYRIYVAYIITRALPQPVQHSRGSLVYILVELSCWTGRTWEQPIRCHTISPCQLPCWCFPGHLTFGKPCLGRNKALPQ
jgi:hypothetical protein